jgi:hypothetical protein
VLQAGTKGEPIKSKSINDEDQKLGFRPEDKGMIGYKLPSEPEASREEDPKAWKRYDQRAAEFHDQKPMMDYLSSPFDERPAPAEKVTEADLAVGKTPADIGKPWMGDPKEPAFSRDDTSPEGKDAWDRYDQRVEDGKRSELHDWTNIDGERMRVRVFVDDNGVIRMKEGMDRNGEIHQLEPRPFAGDQDTFAVRGPDGQILGDLPRDESGHPLSRADMSQEQWDAYRDGIKLKADLFHQMDAAGLHRQHGDISTWTPHTPVHEGIKKAIMGNHNWDPTGTKKGDGLISFGGGRKPRVAYGNAR